MVTQIPEGHSHARPGRPSKGPRKTFSTRLAVDKFQVLQAIVEERGGSTNDLVEEILSDWIERRAASSQEKNGQMILNLEGYRKTA